MKIGFTCGVFDLFHAGHVMMLQECKNNCDYLIVALNKAENISETINPGKKKPIFTIEERVTIMKACRYVDEVLIYNSEEELLEILKTKNITIRFLGEDYKGKKITGSDLPIQIYYTDRSHGLSTSFYRLRSGF
ncbi:MAG: adenylyltransferase/cytidyltransferase family protein [Bacteroidota bacterium]|nr:adenylyltransferase/cytidyltransferase family protein [Bacteroidota bacterium]MDP3146157.1 adenylyltransferase/cytidyltransferase family protein [Bacteroidota bacterium]MDP3556690.1 adenylyltransferase/cytidyltransferase family protein [Bacteroidota bacterium]